MKVLVERFNKITFSRGIRYSQTIRIWLKLCEWRKFFSSGKSFRGNCCTFREDQAEEIRTKLKLNLSERFPISYKWTIAHPKHYLKWRKMNRKALAREISARRSEDVQRKEAFKLKVIPTNQGLGASREILARKLADNLRNNGLVQKMAFSGNTL